MSRDTPRADGAFEVLAGMPVLVMRTRGEVRASAGKRPQFPGVGRLVLVADLGGQHTSGQIGLRRHGQGFEVNFDSGEVDRDQLMAAAANDNTHFVSIFEDHIVFNTGDHFVLPEFED